MDEYTDDRAHEQLAAALAQVGSGAGEDAVDEDAVDDTVLAETDDSASVSSGAFSGGLAGIDSLPGRVRRKFEPLLAEDEVVECVVEGRGKSGTRYLVATTHRVIALAGGRNSSEPESLSLPYHRTEPAKLSDSVITLSCNEFGTAVSATIEPRDGSTLEVSHILDRLASA